MQVQLVLNGHVVDAEVDAVDLANAVVALLNGDASNRAFTEAFEAVDQKTITDGTAPFMPQVPVGYERFQEQTPFLLKGTSTTFNAIRHGVRPMQQLVTTPQYNGLDDTEYHGAPGTKIYIYATAWNLTDTNEYESDGFTRLAQNVYGKVVDEVEIPESGVVKIPAAKYAQYDDSSKNKYVGYGTWYSAEHNAYVSAYNGPFALGNPRRSRGV